MGFVAIVGRPNVGKSTFLNQALDYHLTAVSNRPNTTRKRWLGILSDADSQIIFADTPGVHASSNRMQEAMADTVASQVEGNDLVLCLCDPTRPFGDEDRRVADLVRATSKPVLLVVNKVDAASDEEVATIRDAYLEIVDDATVLELSAKNGAGMEALIDTIRIALPEGPFLFPDDQLTDVIERDIAEELIREAAYEWVRQELPQSIFVEVTDWAETEKKIKITATLHVERESQKAIVIGERGSRVNQIRKSARETLREDLEKFVDVRLSVKVSPDWQNRKRFLSDKRVVDLNS